MSQQSSVGSMKIGLFLDTGDEGLQGRTPRFSELVEMAHAVEEVGLDSLWLCDHLIFRFPERPERGVWEVFTLLSALAAHTTRIDLGTMVVCTSFRPPALVAKMADTIDEISAGRLILGLGAGWHKPEYDAFGYPFDHLAGRFEEAIQIIAPLLREGHVDFQGQYYQVNDAVLRPRGPSQTGPRILIAGHRPRMLGLTARYADAWNTAWHVDPSEMEERVAAFREACAASGREVELTAGGQVRLAVGGKSERGMSGSPESIAQQIQRFAEAGVTHLILTLDPAGVESIRQLGQIVSLVRQM